LEGTHSTHDKLENCVGLKKFKLENVKGRDNTVDLEVNGNILKKILNILCGMVYIGFIWLRIRFSGGLLRIRY
jgi:hypothetical protein